jgi:CheY-like chemotaxis protein
MAANLAAGLHVPLYPAESIKEIERLSERLNVAFIFMGQEEYEDNPDYFDRLSKGDIVVAVSAYPDFKPGEGSNVIIMPKPLYAYPVIRILNEGRNAGSIEFSDNKEKFVLNGVKALIVDDEPMNLVVASGLFSDYEMSIETAGSGKEAVQKFRKGDFNVVFMDHMMPEMDGVEAMKRIKKEASDENRSVAVVALTANAVSGAKEMFMEEGFDGFIAKPIDIGEFERVMKNIINAGKLLYEGRNRL